MTIPEPRPITEDEFLTVPEIAYLGNSPRRPGETLTAASVEQWRSARHRDTGREFPAEDDSIGDRPVWRLSRVIAYLESQGYSYDVERWRKRRDAGGFRRTSA